MRRWSVLLPAVMVAVVAACGGGDDDSEAGAATSESGLDGTALYEASCAECHGSDLRGTDQGPSHLSVVYEPSHHSDEAFRRATRFGVQAHHWDFGDMEPVEGIDDAELEAIIAYVRAVQEREGFEPYPPEG